MRKSQSKATESSKSKSDDKLRKHTSAYLKYSGMAFQMAAMVVIGVLIGRYVDRKLENEQAIFTALGAIVFLALFFIKFLYDLKREK